MGTRASRRRPRHVRAAKRKNARGKDRTQAPGGTLDEPYFPHCPPPDAPYKTLADFIADAKAKPGQLAFSSGGLYGMSHLPSEIFLMSAGLKARHVPYAGGGPSLTAVIGKQVDFSVNYPANTIPLIRGGKVKALAVIGGKRLKGAPDIPTTKELGIDAEYYGWVGLMAPLKTPKPIVDKLRDAMKQVVEGKAFTDLIEQAGDEVYFLSGAAVEVIRSKGLRFAVIRTCHQTLRAGRHTLGKGIGYGKTILFGEMFAVFGVPVIATALSMTAEAEVVQTTSGGWDIRDKRREAKGYKEEKKTMQIESLERIFAHLRLRPEHLRIVLGGDLPAMSGIGATGASSVAIVRALAEEFNLRLTDDEINAGGYQGEIAYHGPTTSGIDNMVSTYGGIVCLTRGEPNVVRRMKWKEPVEVVIGDTGIIANTKRLLAAFGERRQRSPERYARMLESARQIADEALASIERFDWQNVGGLMNRNQSLLQEAEVSCPELDRLVDVCRGAGALGAKLTGSGGGGCMLALTPGKQLQAKVASAIESRGFQAYRAKLGVY